MDCALDCLGNVAPRDDYCTMEIKIRIAMTKEPFKRKLSLFTIKKNIELKKKLVRLSFNPSIIWHRNLDTNKVGEVFGKLQNTALEENGEDKLTNK